MVRAAACPCCTLETFSGQILCSHYIQKEFIWMHQRSHTRLAKTEQWSLSNSIILMFIPYLCCLYPEQHFSEEQDIRMSTCFCFCSDTGLWVPLGNDPDSIKLTHPSRRLSETGRKYRMRELFIWCRCAIWTSLPACLHLLQFIFFKSFFKIWAKFPESWAFW